jgi:hypothetical protein
MEFSWVSVFFFPFLCFTTFQISGAMIEISDAKSARGDRIAYISGKPEQKQAAENLIQAFIMAT